MNKKEIVLRVSGPILPGSIFMSRVKCGKQNCRCYSEPKMQHSVYRWSGVFMGKMTTRSLTKEMYLDCKMRTKNYKKLRRLLKKESDNALKHAPWNKK